MSAAAATCLGEAVVVEGRARVLVEESGRGEGAFGIGERSLALVDPASCRGPRLVLRFGAGSPTEEALLSGEATAAERSWLLARVGHSPWVGGAADLLATDPPEREAVPRPDFTLRTAAPTWHAGPPEPPRTSWRELPCTELTGAASAAACWRIFVGERFQEIAPARLGPRSVLRVFETEARNQMRKVVLHDEARNRHALVWSDVSRAETSGPFPAPDGLWYAVSRDMDPGFVVTRFSTDGRVLMVRVDREVSMEAGPDGVTLTPLGERAADPERVPWSSFGP